LLPIISEDDFQPSVIIEPTAGIGNFILECIEHFPTIQEVYGIEINLQNKLLFFLNLLLRKTTHTQLNLPKISFFLADIFRFDFTALNIPQEKKLLIIGNPPWITVSQLSQLNATNLPIKSSQKGLTGIESLTGKSNFDISETIITKMIDAFGQHSGKIVFLCKNSVIKNLIKKMPREKYPLTDIKAYSFNTRKIFGKATNASLLVATIAPRKNNGSCTVSTIKKPMTHLHTFGWIDSKFVANIEHYRFISHLDGQSSFEWRQGVKHDCSKVLILTNTSKGYINKRKQPVHIEEALIYPFAKGSQLRTFELFQTKQRIIITQKQLNENTIFIKDKYPLTWQYLQENKKYFTKRKSSIYHNKYSFSIFGIGDYAFKPYKVAIAGFYKQPQFSLLTPINNKPIMTDDTSYFLGFNDEKKAAIICALLNSLSAKQFFKAIVFTDTKRPFTKEVLMRLAITKLLERTSFEEIKQIFEKNDYSKMNMISKNDYKEIKEKREKKGEAI
jgi:hypothetical protein